MYVIGATLSVAILGPIFGTALYAFVARKNGRTFKRAASDLLVAFAVVVALVLVLISVR